MEPLVFETEDVVIPMKCALNDVPNLSIAREVSIKNKRLCRLPKLPLLQVPLKHSDPAKNQVDLLVKVNVYLLQLSVLLVLTVQLIVVKSTKLVNNNFRFGLLSPSRKYCSLSAQPYYLLSRVSYLDALITLFQRKICS